jgi:hydrogenase expression/formation protein HypC
MCLAIPARVEHVDGHEAQVDINGVQRIISLWLTPEARVGDYVILHTGYAISVLDEAQAQESLRLLRELAALGPVEDTNRATAAGPTTVK